MKTYRCKHAVEARRWTDTDEDRELFSAWFERHDAVFETRGPIALLPRLQTRGTPDGDRDTYDVQPGEWIVWMDDEIEGEFVAMENEQFTDTYEEI